MKYTVYYIDEPSQVLTIEKNSAHMAAWLFVKQRPRSDTSQVTVESHPATPHYSPGIAHYRACDLIDIPAPPDEPQPELVGRVAHPQEPAFVISGSIESLRLLGSRLLQSIEEFPSRPKPLGSENVFKYVYGIPIVPGDGFPNVRALSFEADPDLEKYYARYRARRRGLKRFWQDYGRCLFQLIAFLFACIGIWTVAKWLF